MSTKPKKQSDLPEITTCCECEEHYLTEMFTKDKPSKKRKSVLCDHCYEESKHNPLFRSSNGYQAGFRRHERRLLKAYRSAGFDLPEDISAAEGIKMVLGNLWPDLASSEAKMRDERYQRFHTAVKHKLASPTLKSKKASNE